MAGLQLTKFDSLIIMCSFDKNSIYLVLYLV